MATYLLNASDEDMARWKAMAKSEGMTFASWARAALDAFSGAARQEHGVAEVPVASRSESDAHFKPYPKPGKKK